LLQKQSKNKQNTIKYKYTNQKILNKHTKQNKKETKTTQSKIKQIQNLKNVKNIPDRQQYLAQ
jgi:hypothetical protein